MLLLTGRIVTAAPSETNTAQADVPPEFVIPVRPAGAFQFLDGDRVVFVGDTLIERAQNSDYIETFLTARYPGRHVLYRNLGWSGDTVYGDARAGFGTAVEGFEQLRQQVHTLKPTVIFVAYGGNSSFDGPTGLERFEKGYHTLLDMLEATQAEIVLLAPIRHEDLGRPLPDPAIHNESLEQYTQAVSRIAAERGHQFVDLFHDLTKPEGTSDRKPPRLTENGIHLSPYGYWRMARALERGLGIIDEPWTLTIHPGEQVVTATGDAREARLEGFQFGPGRLKFSLTEKRLPEPVAPPAADRSCLLAVKDLSPGKYTLRVDGQTVTTASAEAWGKGVTLRGSPDLDQVEQLRKTIMAKNRLYFYRWRPQNETYLFGFRKHEQGQNAKEVPMFDPLVSELEARIATLRVPPKHDYELTRDK
jgi:lysophospholipase L1-like esterase